jgi:hypothetical protein
MYTLLLLSFQKRTNNKAVLQKWSTSFLGLNVFPQFMYIDLKGSKIPFVVATKQQQEIKRLNRFYASFKIHRRSGVVFSISVLGTGDRGIDPRQV